MILYITYNDRPSGVYWTQVTDVVNMLNGMEGRRVRLLALVSLRGFPPSRRAIRQRCPDAIVLPMVPRSRNWRINWLWVWLVCRLLRPTGIMGRGVFATALALRMRDRGLVARVCFDARAAYGAEWEEFRLVDNDRLIEESALVEKEVIWRADVRMAVSRALVAHWRERLDYRGDRHVVIPCTIGRAMERFDLQQDHGLRARQGWGIEDLVLVYSGTVVGWQSMDLLYDMVAPWLAADPTHRLLFLSHSHPRIEQLQRDFPGQVVRFWVEHEEVLALLGDCDYGLLLRESKITNRVASPTKFAEYLSVGLPILISEGVGDFSALVQELGLGFVVREVGHIDPPKPVPALRERLRAVAIERFSKANFRWEYGRVLDQLHGAAPEWPVKASDDLPLVSIIVPSYNKRRFIGDMVRSVTDQTDGRWELILIDDASTDGSPEFLSELAATDPRIQVLPQSENKGANKCRNIGIARARGRYTLLLDADDLLGPHCIEQRLKVMNGSDLDIAVFTMEVFRTQVGDHGHRWVPDSNTPLLDFFRHDLPWQTMQPLWNTDFLRRIGGFDEGFSRHQDVELHTRALLVPDVRCALFPGRPDCYYRIAEDRKVIDPFPLLRRFCDSAVMYHDKFIGPARAMGLGSLLSGILLRTHLQLLMAVKAGKVDRRALNELEADLLAPVTSGTARTLFRVVRWYNLLPIRITGVNFVLSRLLTGGFWTKAYQSPRRVDRRSATGPSS